MTDASLPGSLGEFRIDAVLGQGGSGIVYDAGWGPRRVALKVLHPSLVHTERVRTQFFAEAERLKTIAHPAVVKVLAVGELPDKRPYLAMERLDGETLASVLARGPLDVPRALELFAELCSAVGALHEQGLIHRDLKPENVFIVGGKHAVLLDFGIAKELAAPASTTTQDGGVRGTPAYMAPERFFGQTAGVATDVYELALILYAMLAGRLPWDDFADPEVRLSPRPLGELCAVPGELDVEIRRALSTRAQNRPGSAHALLESVRAAVGSELAPAASETARMRPAGEVSGKVTVTQEPAPWFAGRQPTTDRGRTPLAWAPTQQAPAQAAPAPRRGRPWIVVGALAIAVGGGAVWWRLSRTPAHDEPVTPAAAIVPLTPDKDPWGAAPVAGTPPGEPAAVAKPAAAAAHDLLPGPALPVAQARKELAAAIGYMPPDTHVVVTGLVGELRRDERFANLFARGAAKPDIALVLASTPACVREMLGNCEWGAFGSAKGGDAAGTLIMRGDWKRAEVEKCFADQVTPKRMPDGKTILELDKRGWIDFIDDHTLYVSVRSDLDAAAVHAIVTKPGKGATPRARALLATIPKDATAAFVFDGEDLAFFKGDVPQGSELAGWFRATPEGLDLGVSIDTRNEATARDLEKDIHEKLDEFLALTNEKTIGKIEVARTKAVVQIKGRLTSVALRMFAK